MDNITTELNSHGQPRKKNKNGEYIYRPGRPISNPGKLISLRIQPYLHEWLNSQGNKTEYINMLIQKDMEQRQMDDEYKKWEMDLNEEEQR